MKPNCVQRRSSTKTTKRTWVRPDVRTVTLWLSHARRILAKMAASVYRRSMETSRVSARRATRASCAKSPILVNRVHVITAVSVCQPDKAAIFTVNANRATQVRHVVQCKTPVALIHAWMEAHVCACVRHVAISVHVLATIWVQTVPRLFYSVKWTLAQVRSIFFNTIKKTIHTFFHFHVR